MNLSIRKLVLSFVTLCALPLCAAEESFILVDGVGRRVAVELGSHIDERATPCSTFKIALSLMGFDTGVLIDEESPVWEFQPEYPTYLETWKGDQTPQSWMRYSCVWYSQLITQHIGMASIGHYLNAFEYGNQDMSGGLTQAWIGSSLTISPREQAYFIDKMIQNELGVSTHATETTRSILYQEELADGWRLLGKTGFSGSLPTGLQIGWFVGWVEKEGQYFPFAYQIRDTQIDLGARIPRTKELLNQSLVMASVS